MNFMYGIYITPNKYDFKYEMSVLVVMKSFICKVSLFVQLSSEMPIPLLSYKIKKKNVKGDL